MHDGQDAPLSSPLSEQATGIVLHWQKYVPGEGLRDQGHNYVFVPKTHAAVGGVSMLMVATNAIVFKYVYVHDDRLEGNENNASTSYDVSGIKLDNRGLVLTEIIGV